MTTIITSNIMKPEYQDLYRLFGMYYFALDEFMPWQVITHMFMHASMSHIFFNMFGLVSLGGILEKFWGFQVGKVLKKYTKRVLKNIKYQKSIQKFEIF